MQTRNWLSDHRFTATRLACALALLALLASLVFPALRTVKSAPAVGGIEVTTTDDELNSDGDCSLREAVQAANTDEAVDGCTAGSGADIITFAVEGAIPVKDATIFINSNVSLVGPIILNGKDNGAQMFRVSSGGTLNLSNLTFQDAGRGAILNSLGTLDILGVSFQNNTKDTGCGAIESNGELNILMSTFAGNKAEGAARNGGAICASGSEPVRISLSNFNGNIASGSGGAIAVTGTGTEVEISDSIFSGNIANGEDPAYHGGGAIQNNSDALTIIRCAFNGNLSPNGGGGGLYNKIGKVIAIEDSSFNGNIAGGLADGLGGAIYNTGDLAVTRSTFNGNQAVPTEGTAKGGAIYSDKQGDVQVVNSTFFANGAPPPTGQGGAVYNADNGLSSKIEYRFYHVTFTDNSAGEGGAIYNDNETIRLYNTIVDEGDLGLGGTCAGDVPLDGGGNIQSPADACGSTITQTADMHLGAPAFNGGPLVSLLTIMPESGSPAIDAAEDGICLAAPVNGEDQRGESRPTDGDGDGNATCDAGAMETEAAIAGYGSDPLWPGPIQIGSTFISTTISATLEVFETGNTTLRVTSPNLSGAHAADFGLPSAFSIADGGSPVGVELTCTPSDVQTRTATLTFSTNDPTLPTVDYQLQCIGTDIPEPGYGSTPPPPGPIDFGNVEVDKSKNLTLRIFESGTADLQVDSLPLGGVNPDVFSLGTSFPIDVVNDGAPQDVTITCQPPEPGIHTAILSFTTNDPHNTNVSYDLSCTGFIPPGPPLDPDPVMPVSTPYDVAVSPDGKHLYVTNQGGSQLMVYARDPVNGSLALVQSYSEAELGTPYGVAVSPDGNHVFVTSQANDALHVLSREPETGTVSTFDVIKDGDLVRCSTTPPILCLYVDGLNNPDGIALSPDGQSIYVAAAGDNAVSLFSRQVPTGTVTYLHRVKDSQGSVTGLMGATDVAVSPDGNHVYATAGDSPVSGSDGAVTLFSRNPLNGWLTYAESYTDSASLWLGGAAAVELSPDGAQVYVAAQSDNALMVFAREPANGTLTRTQLLFDLWGIDGFAGAHGIATSPDGSQVYVSSVTDNALVVLDRDMVDGLLTFRQVYEDGVDGVDGLAGASRVDVSPDKRHVYVTGYLDNAIAIFSIAKPAPVLTSLDPSSATAGDPAFSLTTFGERFSSDSVVQWDSADRETTFVSSTELRAEISATDVATPGTTPVQVYTPPPGGGLSTVLRFVVGAPDDNPVPTIQSLDPAGAMAGSPALTLTVNGSNFVSGAVVQWNGNARDTTFVDDVQLQAAIPASDLAAPGTAGVAVWNPGPGGGTSNVLSFEIAGPGENPLPSVERISPSSVPATGARGDDLTVTVYGANFVPGSQVYLGEALKITDYVSDTQLLATFTAGDTAFAGAWPVTVVNPKPGGGTSNSVTFQVTSQVVDYVIFLPLVIKS